jgi:hypothetical protein
MVRMGVPTRKSTTTRRMVKKVREKGFMEKRDLSENLIDETPQCSVFGVGFSLYNILNIDTGDPPEGWGVRRTISNPPQAETAEVIERNKTIFFTSIFCPPPADSAVLLFVFSRPCALRLVPYALLLQLHIIHVCYFQFYTHFVDFAVKIFYQSI